MLLLVMAGQQVTFRHFACEDSEETILELLALKLQLGPEVPCQFRESFLTISWEVHIKFLDIVCQWVEPIIVTILSIGDAWFHCSVFSSFRFMLEVKAVT